MESGARSGAKTPIIARVEQELSALNPVKPSRELRATISQQITKPARQSIIPILTFEKLTA
jgi:hypothetical protein